MSIVTSSAGTASSSIGMMSRSIRPITGTSLSLSDSSDEERHVLKSQNPTGLEARVEVTIIPPLPPNVAGLWKFENNKSRTGINVKCFSGSVAKNISGSVASRITLINWRRRAKIKEESSYTVHEFILSLKLVQTAVAKSQNALLIYAKTPAKTLTRLRAKDSG